MAYENRVITCDICGYQEEEEDFNTGWTGWSILNGVGSCAPEKDKSIRKRNMETCMCPQCTQVVSVFINNLQKENKS